MSEARAREVSLPRVERDERREDAPQLRCDFCGESVPRVRRVALDRDYERLQTPHTVRYACSRCSEEKERSRLGD